MSALIELKHLTKSYETPAGTFTAIKDISLEIGQGEHLAIVGRSGSGKSTLLNLLSAIDRASSGTVTIGGVKISELDESRSALWRGKNIGIVFQFFQLIPTLSIGENILLAMEFVNVIPKKNRVPRMHTLLDKVGIGVHRDKLPAALSGGEQQRAAIARALANDPPLVIADEPTGNLDSHNTQVIQGYFKSLVEAGKTLIVVTHEAVSASDYSRVLTLQDGEILSDRRS